VGGRTSCTELGLRRGRTDGSTDIHKVDVSIHVVEKSPTPSLLPILRSQQQAELLSLLLGDSELEVSLTDLSSRLGIPFASVHREVERAERAGLLRSRKVGNTRLVRADPSSPYFGGLATVLVRAFGVPAVLGRALYGLTGVDQAFVFGSWAARFSGEDGERPVQDIDLLVLGDPDRNELYERTE
jgi:DNA-binding Lrp family transcriptional regulator